MFEKRDRVLVANPYNFAGPSRWKGMYGTVIKIDSSWVYVEVDGVDPEPVPFRASELELVT